MMMLLQLSSALIARMLAICVLSTHALSPVLIAGRRCMLNIDNNVNSNQQQHPPLIIIGGTAQTIASWEHHIPALSKNRNVMIYECIGQGPAPADLSDVSLPMQAQQLQQTINQAFPASNQKIDFVCYSLGARIAMAYAVSHPSRVRKLHLTGVATAASDAGHVAIEAWKDLLRSNNLQGFGWSILQSTYGATFLRRNSHRLAQWVQFVVDTNSADGLLAILEQTWSLEEWSNVAMSKQMAGSIEGCIVVGESDQMAPPKEAQILSDKLGWRRVEVVNGCGHALPTEEPRIWRKHVLDFLNE